MTISEVPPTVTEPSRPVDVVGWTEDARGERPDTVVVEEPLEIRLAGCSVAVTMRTPGGDLDLAAGFLFTEGIIRSPADIASLAHCPTDDGAPGTNVVNLNPSDPALVDPERWRRNFFATSSCGLCGKASIDAIRQEAAPIDSGIHISHRSLYRLEAELRAAQQVFGETGGLHAAGLFDVGCAEPRRVSVREDVGRHNAVDKVAGDALRRGLLPLRQHVLLVSGRASFEVVQKALMAGIPIVAAVSAPSSLAVDLARSTNMTLVGFLRPGRFNVYTRPERIVMGSPPSVLRSSAARKNEFAGGAHD